MTSLGKLIFGFMVIGICIVGTIMILAQLNNSSYGGMNIGNTSINTTMLNQTSGLLSQTTSFGSTAVVVILFVLGALIIIGSLALIAGRK
jgi:heme/copper-type cytochrome/quinol oxidase subunit 4